MKINNIKISKHISWVCFTLALIFSQQSIFAQTGPGGVTTGLVLWLKADGGTVSTSGNQVTRWDNSITNAAITTQAGRTASTAVTLSQNSVNFNPSLDFLGTSGQRLVGNTSTTNYWDSKNSFYTAASARAKNEVVMGIFASSTRGIRFDGSTSNQYTVDGTAGNPGSSTAGTAQNTGLGLQIISGFYTNTTTSNTSIFKDNLLINTFTGTGVVATGTNNFEIGGRTFGSLPNRTFNGLIPEVIVYDTKSTDTQRTQINSYLAIKYGLTLTPGVSSNYLASDQTVIWTGTAAYQRNVFGLGLDTNSTLNQQISRSQVTGDILTISTDNNFTNGNGTHTTIANNMSYLVIGNNNGSTAVSATNLLGTTNFKKINKTWRIQNTSMEQCVNYQFDLAAPAANTKWYVVIADNDTFTTNVEYKELIVSGGKATTAIDFPVATTSFMTLALLDKSSLATVVGGSVGISTTGHNFLSSIADNSYLDIRANNLGLVLPRVNGTSGITQVEGMMIYDTSDNTFKVSNGTNWRPLGSLTKFCD